MNMKLWICILLFGLLTACGSAGGSESYQPGLSVSGNLLPSLEEEFKAVQECTGIHEAVFSDLSIEVAPYPIKCETTTSIACFHSPNKIELSWTALFKHEVVHYLLYVKYNDPDQDHKSDFFQTCT